MGEEYDGPAPGDYRLRCKSVVAGSLSAYTAFHSLYKSKKSRVWMCKNASGTQVVLKAYTVTALSGPEIVKVRLSTFMLSCSLGDLDCPAFSLLSDFLQSLRHGE